MSNDNDDPNPSTGCLTTLVIAAALVVGYVLAGYILYR